MRDLLTSLAAEKDPYVRLDSLVRFMPLYQDTPGEWVVSGYDMCARVLRDPRIGMDLESLSRWWRFTPDQLATHVSYQANHRRSLHMLNPPGHSALRRFFGAEFRGRPVRARTPQVLAVIDEILDGLVGLDEIDLLGDFAIPVSTGVIGKIMGVPNGIAHQMFPLVVTKNQAFEPGQDGAVVAEAAIVRDQLETHFRELLAEKRRQPAADLLTVWSQPGELGLDDTEIASNAALVFAAAVDTVAQAICVGLWHALRPDLDRPPTGDSGGISEAFIAELLRHSGPVMLAPRSVLHDLTLGGHTLRRGDLVVLLIGAANRDPRWFQQPDRFLPDRTERQSLAFGSGPHRCMGASLAVLEVRLAIDRFLTRFRHPVVEETLRYDRFTIRGLRGVTAKLTT